MTFFKNLSKKQRPALVLLKYIRTFASCNDKENEKMNPFAAFYFYFYYFTEK